MAINQYPEIPSFYKRVQVFASSGTFVHPDGYNSNQPVYVIVMGGGGGGASGASKASVPAAFVATSAGGASGTVSSSLLHITADVSVTVGAGGTGGAAAVDTGNGNPGVSGGSSSFGNYLLTGGGGGSSRYLTSGLQFLSGASGGTGANNQVISANTAAAVAGKNGLSFGASSIYWNSSAQMIGKGQNGYEILAYGATSAQIAMATQGPLNPFSLYCSGSGAEGGWTYGNVSAQTAAGGTGGIGYYGNGGNGGACFHTIGTTAATGVAGTNGSGYGAGGGGGGAATATGAAVVTSGKGGNGSAGLVVVFY